MAVVRGRVTAAIVSFLAFSVVSGCGQTEGGLASPKSASSSFSAPASQSNDPDAGAHDNAMLEDPCKILTEAEMAQYGDFEEPKDETVGGYPTCTWTEPGDSASDVEAPIVSFTYRDDLAADEVVDLGDGVVSGKTESSARKVVKTSGINPVMDTPDCLIAMEIEGSSRFDVLVGRTAEPCELAEQIVELIDAKLPRG